MEEQYLDKFEEKLQDELVRICTVCHHLDGMLLNSEDVDNKWESFAPEYIADAVIQVQNYPTVSVAWASYLGMAVAYGWDVDWQIMSKYPYQSYYGNQGFDNMDEHIVKNILGIPLDSKEAEEIEVIIRKCGETAVGNIRHEHLEPQSRLAYLIFARTCRVMFRIGAAIELKRLGYKFEKVQTLN